MSVNRPGDDANFVFGATVQSGSQYLVAGRCDASENCEYAKVPVTVKNAAGAPDCDSPGAGQELLEHDANGYSITPLTDGRALLGVFGDESEYGYELHMLAPDGTTDLSFGTFGRTKLMIEPDYVAQLGDGSFFVLDRLQGYLGHVTAQGAMDAAFGDNVGNPGVRFFTCTSTEIIGCRGIMRSDGSGGVWVAGAQNYASTVAHIDAAGNVVESTTLDPNFHDVLAIDSTGRALFVSNTDVIVGSIAGLDTSFGSSGHLDYGSLGLETDVRLSGSIEGSQIVIAGLIDDGTSLNLEVRTIVDGVVHPPIKEKILSSKPGALLGPPGAVLTLSDAAGRAYVATSRERTPSTDAWLPTDTDQSTPDTTDDALDTEIITLRLVAGALDPGFGTGGIATMSSRDVWPRVVTESMIHRTQVLAVGPNGEPWLLASSGTSAAWKQVGQPDPYLERIPNLMLATIRP